MGNRVTTTTEVEEVCAGEVIKPAKKSKYDDRERSFRLQVASDIHLEFLNLNSSEDEAENKEHREAIFSKLLKPSAPYLALLGDIGSPAHPTKGKEYKELLQWCSSQWEEVWVVAGNHEYYSSNIQETEAAITKACEEAGENVKFLQKTALVKNGVRICGASLWSNIPDSEGENIYNRIRMSLSDYKHISIHSDSTGNVRKLEPKDTHAYHLDHVEWIKNQMKQAEENNEPLVVLTHHAPSMNCSEPDIPATNPVSHAFCSPLEELFEDPVVLWAFGHTHYPFDERYGTTRVISNPVGYPFEYPEPYGKPYYSDIVLEV